RQALESARSPQENEMNRPENFLFDVRVRERMIAQGLLSDEAISGHLEALNDRAEQLETLDLEQPALVSEKPPPEPAPVLGGLGVPTLSPIQSQSPVRPLDAGV